MTDTGAGIPADKLPAIFEKFTQADGSITRKYGGTGLGLAITRRLVEMHGGDDCASKAKSGKGSTFTVTLPCEPAPAPAAGCGPLQTRAARFRCAGSAPAARVCCWWKIIWSIRKSCWRFCARRAITSTSPTTAGRRWPSWKRRGAAYDLILMDVQMPVLDGLEATRIIRRNPRWEHVPIVAMTAHAMNGDRERCLQAGMDAYISKPVQPAHLIATIEKHLVGRPLRTLRRRPRTIPRPSPDRPSDAAIRR